MDWILIVLMFGASSDSGKAAMTANFGDKPACVAAAKAMVDELNSAGGLDRNRIVVTCSPFYSDLGDGRGITVIRKGE